jgi:hypothetical protein
VRTRARSKKACPRKMETATMKSHLYTSVLGHMMMSAEKLKGNWHYASSLIILCLARKPPSQHKMSGTIGRTRSKYGGPHSFIRKRRTPLPATPRGLGNDWSPPMSCLMVENNDLPCLYPKNKNDPAFQWVR